MERYPPPVSPEIRILRIQEVRARTGLSRTQIYRLEKAGKFPTSVRLNPEHKGSQAHGWLSNEITDWILSRPTSRGSASHGGALS